MDEILVRFWHDIVGRVGGPMTFRLILQPLVAATLGLRAGLKDARQGRPPYLWSVITEPATRWAVLREGLRDITRICVLASFIDGVYQYAVLHWFYPMETVLVVLVLAVVPYTAVRGPVNRLAGRIARPKAGAPKRA
jgi:hypothetical protein